MKKLAFQKEDTLEEMWRIKREIGAEYPTWDAYVAGLLAFQEEERKRGVKFVSLPPRKPDVAPSRSVAENSPGYDTPS